MNLATDIWAKVLELMQPDMTTTTIHTWFDDATAVALEEDRFVLYSPTRFKRDIIATRYVPFIQKALHELFSTDFDVAVLTEGELDTYQQPAKSSFLPGTEEYTFERFVVGSSNKFAHAAARAVADNPGHSYNPLFIYGESGLGKTHLLYAIAHTIHDNHPDYKVVYIKGDTFTNELIQAIREGRNSEFREKYRGADVFLMDDVQFIAGRDSTQEEMFHTFNTLYELKKQIVFTADRPPKEMLRLEDRLKVWSVVALVDVRADVLDDLVGLRVGLALLFDPLDGVQDGGVVPVVELFADVFQGELGHVPGEIDGDVPGPAGGLGPPLPPDGVGVDVVEFADLLDDDLGGGQDV